jgi:hypothetical protein
MNIILGCCINKGLVIFVESFSQEEEENSRAYFSSTSAILFKKFI